MSSSQKAEAERSHRCSLLWKVNPRRGHEGLGHREQRRKFFIKVDYKTAKFWTLVIIQVEASMEAPRIHPHQVVGL